MSPYVATPRSGWQPCFAAISSALSMSATENATRCMPISLGRVGLVSIASGRMYSKSSSRPLPSGVCSMAILAWLPSSPTAVSAHSPLTVSRPSTVRPRSVKKAIAASMSWTAIPTFSNLMGMSSAPRGAVDQLTQDVRVAGVTHRLARHVRDHPSCGVPLVVLGGDRHHLVEALEVGEDLVALGDGVAVFSDDVRTRDVLRHGHRELEVVNALSGQLVAEPVALGVDQMPDKAEQ